ncbi:Delta 14 sterol reductase TM7SF2 [Taenia solium]|eukprot:TsM_000131700 transcript=TsM_000131700 gene=TsM_000131700
MVYKRRKSRSSDSVNLVFFMPLFVYWCTFLAVFPTNATTFSRIYSRRGRFVAFFGAELPFDLGFINPYVFFGVAFFNRIIMFLNRLVPFGRPFVVVAGEHRWQHKCNGILIVMLCLLAAALYGFMGARFVGGSQLFELHTFLSSIFFGAWADAFVFAMHVFLSSRQIRAPAALVGYSGNLVVNFYNGIEVRPMIFGLDVKVLSYCASFIGGFILQFVFVIYQYHEHVALSFGLITLLLLHSICILDFFVYEPTVLHAHDVVYYGCGLGWFQNALLVQPLLRSVGVLYLAYNYYALHSSWDFLPHYGFPAAGAALFILGLYIRRRATNQKFFYYGLQRHSFEVVSSLDSGATRSIVTVGWWACVRHPDYLGEVISSLGLALTAGVGSVAPWIASLCVFFDVLLRIHWDEGMGLARYDKAAWERYTAAVPYRLIPWIY